MVEVEPSQKDLEQNIPTSMTTTTMNGFASSNDEDDHWAAARTRSAKARSGFGPTIQMKNEGFFQRSRRKMSATLPTFNRYGVRTPNDWREAEKLGRGRWRPGNVGGTMGRCKTMVGNLVRRFRVVLLLVVLVVGSVVGWRESGAKRQYNKAAALGGGSNFVIILAANEGGGVMEWKGPREWAIERDSVRNKRRYADRWGYHLELADMSTKKRYAHEWRESWEKVDVIRNAMAKYPKAEWFWWLDLNTFIMEPSISLQRHIFKKLDSNVYRDINYYNPLEILHPPNSTVLDPITSSPSGDNKSSSIDLVLSQDCSGFNLGSFFVRRSAFADRMLDLWWDPVLYEQKHMDWEHKEQDALEHLYQAQPYIRSHTAFIEQRKINSFPPGACGVEEKDVEGKPGAKPKTDPRFHYSEKDRDFMVNMAGCEWGRDCWSEIYSYRELSNKLNRSGWEKFKDWWSERFRQVKARWQHAGEEEDAGS